VFEDPDSPKPAPTASPTMFVQVPFDFNSLPDEEGAEDA
jgi:hypothetical protein